MTSRAEKSSTLTHISEIHKERIKTQKVLDKVKVCHMSSDTIGIILLEALLIKLGSPAFNNQRESETQLKKTSCLTPLAANTSFQLKNNLVSNLDNHRAIIHFISRGYV